MNIIIASAIKKYFRTFCNTKELTFRFIIKSTSNIIIGINGGYNFMLSKKLPLSNSIIERCIPQPGHSIPKKCFVGQGKR